MQTNLPVWNYYPKTNGYYVDPLYQPYLRKLEPTQNPDGSTQICPYNLTKKQGCPSSVNPGLVRKGWGMSFQLMHPDKDPAPAGWTKGKDGWCVENVPEFGDNGLYSEDAFVPRYQYWESYAPQLKNPRYKEINQFDNKSVSPWSGDYVIYQHSKISSNRRKYGHLPSKDSYIA